jgi:hypothetical protein
MYSRELSILSVGSRAGYMLSEDGKVIPGSDDKLDLRLAHWNRTSLAVAQSVSRFSKDELAGLRDNQNEMLTKLSNIVRLRIGHETDLLPGEAYARIFNVEGIKLDLLRTSTLLPKGLQKGATGMFHSISDSPPTVELEWENNEKNPRQQDLTRITFTIDRTGLEASLDSRPGEVELNDRLLPVYAERLSCLVKRLCVNKLRATRNKTATITSYTRALSNVARDELHLTKNWKATGIDVRPLNIEGSTTWISAPYSVRFADSAKNTSIVVVAPSGTQTGAARSRSGTSR